MALQMIIMICLLAVSRAELKWRQPFEDSRASARRPNLNEDQMIILKTLRFYDEQRKMQDEETIFGLEPYDVIQKLTENTWVTSYVRDALADVNVVTFYFSAAWCLSCKQFTQMMKEAYENKGDAKVEVVYVSDDANEERMKSFMNEFHGKWYAVGYGSELARRLHSKFNIRSIPTLVATDQIGLVVDIKTRDQVLQHGSKYFQKLDRMKR